MELLIVYMDVGITDSERFELGKMCALEGQRQFAGGVLIVSNSPLTKMGF